MPTFRTAVLRPRELVLELYARALDDDLDAEADLHALSAVDPRADSALDALAAADVQAWASAGNEGGMPAPVDPALLDRVLTAISAADNGRTGEPVSCPCAADPARRGTAIATARTGRRQGSEDPQRWRDGPGCCPGGAYGAMGALPVVRGDH